MRTRTFRVYGADSLGVAVREFRRLRAMSQAELARRAGIHRSYLSELEGGKVTEQLDRLVRLCHILGVRIRLDAELDVEYGTDGSGGAG